MAINRFFKPVDYEYTPIPFQELVTLGKYYADERKQAEKDLATNIKTFGKFVSPSAVDMENYKKASIDKLAPFVEQAAANPSLMKDASFRAQIQNAINNIDYVELGSYERSRDAMLERQKINQQLALAGKYNPLWHDVDFYNYDSSTQGIFQDTAPIAYKSEVDMVKPLMDNLKSRFIASDGIYDYTGVSTADTDALLAKNISAIRNTPEYAMHVQSLMKRGASKEDAIEILDNSLFLAGREFAYTNRDVNEFAKLREASNLKMAEKRAAAEAEANPNGTVPFTELITAQGAPKFDKLREQLFWQTNTMKATELQNRLADAKNKNDQQAYNAVMDEYNAEINKMGDFGQVIGDIIHNTYADEYGWVSNDNVRKAINDVGSRIINPYKDPNAVQVTRKRIPNISDKPVDSPFGKSYELTSIGDMQLLSNTILKLGDYDTTANEGNMVMNFLQNNRIKGYVTGQRGYITIPSMGGATNINVSTIAVSKQDLLKMTGGDATKLEEVMHKIGATHLKADNNGKYTESIEGKYENNVWVPKNKSRRNYTGYGEYYELDMTSLIPKTSDPLDGTSINNEYDTLTSGQTGARELYPTRQQQMDIAGNYDEYSEY